MRRLALFAVLALAAVAFWFATRAALDGPTAANAPEAVTLNRGNGHEPESLDPQRGRVDSEHIIMRDLFEGLTALDEQARPVPAAASAWTVSADGLTYAFTLRSGLRWSNGDPLGAEDFAFGLRRLVDPATASPYAQIVDMIDGASEITAGKRDPSTLGVTVTNPSTLAVRLRAPAPYLPGVFAHPSTFPVHRSSLERHAREFTRPGNLVSNGAFVLRDWSVGSLVSAVRNPYYWNDANNRIDVVRFHHVSDQSAELRRYRAGELDITYVVPPAQFQWVRENLPAELHVAPQLTTYYYGFNLSRAPFKDNVGLRRALAMVIDRERLTQSVTGRGELPAYGWVPSGIDQYSPQLPEWARLPFAERVAEARRLYAQAGYSAARPLRTEIRYNADESHARIALAVASMWKEHLGVETSLVGEEFKVLLQNITQAQITQVFRSSWIGDYNDAYTFTQYLKSDFGINLPQYHNAEYDRLVTAAAAEPDRARRRALLEQAERLMLQDQPLIPLYFYVSKHLVKPWVQGWRNNVMNVQYSKDMSITGRS
jgi:oligopeptide transport system substrate-binding protein